MTKRQKELVWCIYPSKMGATRKEIKQAKLLARGKYWEVKEFTEYVAFSPNGKRQYFEYDIYSWRTETQLKEWKKICKNICRLWCAGHPTKANRAYDKFYTESFMEHHGAIRYVG